MKQSLKRLLTPDGGGRIKKAKILLELLETSSNVERDELNEFITNNKEYFDDENEYP